MKYSSQPVSIYEPYLDPDKKKKLKQKLYTHKLLYRDMLVDNIYLTRLGIILQCSGMIHALILTREMHRYLEVSAKPG